MTPIAESLEGKQLTLKTDVEVKMDLKGSGQTSVEHIKVGGNQPAEALKNLVGEQGTQVRFSADGAGKVTVNGEEKERIGYVPVTQGSVVSSG